jgi:hypothetical protein
MPGRLLISTLPKQRTAPVECWRCFSGLHTPLFAPLPAFHTVSDPAPELHCVAAGLAHSKHAAPHKSCGALRTSDQYRSTQWLQAWASEPWVKQKQKLGYRSSGRSQPQLTGLGLQEPPQQHAALQHLGALPRPASSSTASSCSQVTACPLSAACHSRYMHVNDNAEEHNDEWKKRCARTPKLQLSLWRCGTLTRVTQSLTQGAPHLLQLQHEGSPSTQHAHVCVFSPTRDELRTCRRCRVKCVVPDCGP